MTAVDWMALTSVVAVAVLLTALASCLIVIVGELEALGGSPTSLLAKIRLGRRAIETQTGHVVQELPALNARMLEFSRALATLQENLSRESTPPEGKG